MQAVLYVCHGSRMDEAVEEAIQFTRRGMDLVDIPVQTHCFLELARPTIQQGIDQCVEQGATRIAIVPVLLLTAKHAKEDIPLEISQAQERYPGAEMTYGHPFGIDEQMVDVLVEHVKGIRKDTKDMNILLVGRGSSDQDAIADTKEIARLLQKRVKVQSVEVCFLVAAQPSFENLVQQTVSKGLQNIVILPYLLFTGLLMRDIKTFVEHLRLNDKQEVHVCNYLGDHPNGSYVLRDRALESVNKEEFRFATMA